MTRRDLSMVVHNGADIIDSRDIIKRIEELEDEATVHCHACGGSGNIEGGSVTDASCHVCEGSGLVPNEHMTEEDKAELAALNKLAGEGISDWHHGATLIRDSYFIDYAKELADDLGGRIANLQWPYTCIDWEQAADELKQDYSCVDYDGVEYWVRS